MDYVWARIMKHNQSEEILKVLDQKMKSNEAITIAMRKMISCLTIFDDNLESKSIINIPDIIEI